jgi:hypothetical protein
MSIRLGQGLSSDHLRPSRRSAFAITMSFLIIAVMATFPDFPARTSWSYFVFRQGLRRVATRAGMYDAANILAKINAEHGNLHM